MSCIASYYTEQLACGAPCVCQLAHGIGPLCQHLPTIDCHFALEVLSTFEPESDSEYSTGIRGAQAGCPCLEAFLQLSHLSCSVMPFALFACRYADAASSCCWSVAAGTASVCPAMTGCVSYLGCVTTRGTLTFLYSVFAQPADTRIIAKISQPPCSGCGPWVLTSFPCTSACLMQCRSFKLLWCQ